VTPPEPAPVKPDPACPECGHPLNCTRGKLADARAVFEQVQKTLREQPARERKYAVGCGWAPEAVCAARLTEAPDLERVVVAVSPALPDEETGIIVAGRDADGGCYVLTDCSGAMTPDRCAWQAISAYRDHKADVICGVANITGDYLEALLDLVFERMVRPDEYAALALERHRDWAFEYKAVHVFRGLPERLKPVGALYEQGRVHHVGALPELEDRMFTWMPGDRKPMGRIEAPVCAVTELTARDA